jgi:hypothetical protein
MGSHSVVAYHAGGQRSQSVDTFHTGPIGGDVDRLGLNVHLSAEAGSKTKPNQTMATLTAKESTLLCAIARGMDAPGSGWLNELAPETLSTAAVLGSLIKKGLATSERSPEVTPGYPPAYWVEITESGLDHATAEVATRGWLSVRA